MIKKICEGFRVFLTVLGADQVKLVKENYPIKRQVPPFETHTGDVL